MRYGVERCRTVFFSWFLTNKTGKYVDIMLPAMDLTGFRRVTLAAGEEKKVVFCLKADQTAFLDVDSFCITENSYIDGEKRTSWAE